jgi:aryl-alcohol dehydrogenase-like predicted oxidoreductase
MQEVTLGKTGLRVSRIAFGTWQLGGDWGATDESAAIAAIRRAADQGVTIFDTAQAYGFGASERLLATALRGRNRSELVIATKGGLRPLPEGGITRDSSPAWIRAGVEASLTALETDYIDLYQLHWPDPTVPFEATAEELAKLQADGKIRHVGVSNFDATQMAEFSATLPVEALQPPYHLFRRDIEASVLPYTASRDIGVLAYGPLAHGLLGGHLRPANTFPDGDWRANSDGFTGAEFARKLRAVADLEKLAHDELGTSVSRLAVAWTLANPAVHVAIVGTRDPGHVDDAIAAADLHLDDQVLSKIDAIMQTEGGNARRRRDHHAAGYRRGDGAMAGSY